MARYESAEMIWCHDCRAVRYGPTMIELHVRGARDRLGLSAALGGRPRAVGVRLRHASASRLTQESPRGSERPSGGRRTVARVLLSAAVIQAHSLGIALSWNELDILADQLEAAIKDGALDGRSIPAIPGIHQPMNAEIVAQIILADIDHVRDWERTHTGMTPTRRLDDLANEVRRLLSFSRSDK